MPGICQQTVQYIDNAQILYYVGHTNCEEVMKMAGTTNLSIRMDKDLKEQADRLFSELGMNMTTALNIFVRQSVRQGKIPFEISLHAPNSETIAAMEEAEKIARDPMAKEYTNLDELFKALKA